MYEFWYDYVKPKYNEKSKLCDMNTDSYQNTMKNQNCVKWIQTIVLLYT